jgi:hypothetical protein
MEFEDAVARLTHLLAEIGWPPKVVWIRADQVVHFPARSTIVFRPEPDAEAEAHARNVFKERFGRAPAISFYAPGHAGGRTFAYVEPIDELADGESMFVADGLKIAAQGDVVPTYVTSSRFWWWLYRANYRRWRLGVRDVVRTRTNDRGAS